MGSGGGNNNNRVWSETAKRVQADQKSKAEADENKKRSAGRKALTNSIHHGLILEKDDSKRTLLGGRDGV